MNFLFAVDIAAALEVGERRKIRKPKDRTMAKAMLMGLVLRKDLGSAMMRGGQSRTLVSRLKDFPHGEREYNQGFMLGLKHNMRVATPSCKGAMKRSSVEC